MQGCQKKIHIAADLENLIIMPNGIRELDLNGFELEIKISIGNIAVYSCIYFN